VRLPLVIGEAASAEPHVDAPRQRRRVMLVEDNADTREVLTAALELAGHEVTASPDGDDALDRAIRQPPEVMLIDIGLPGRDGYQLARDVRAALGQGPRLIALTGYGQPDDRRHALEAGFDEHITKPVDLQTLELALSPTRRTG
jgi:CheY-like chemotaxis protein